MFRILDDDTLRLSLGNYFQKEYDIRYLYFNFPEIIRKYKLLQIRLLAKFHGSYTEIEFVYEIADELLQEKKIQLDDNHYLGIDLGMNNFAACFATTETSFIMEGMGIKSYNRWWNKQKAQLQSIYDLQGIDFGQKMAHLLIKRRNLINNFMAQNVNYLIKFCLANRIGNIVVGINASEAREARDVGSISMQTLMQRSIL